MVYISPPLIGSPPLNQTKNLGAVDGMLYIIMSKQLEVKDVNSCRCLSSRLPFISVGGELYIWNNQLDARSAIYEHGLIDQGSIMWGLVFYFQPSTSPQHLRQRLRHQLVDPHWNYRYEEVNNKGIIEKGVLFFLNPRRCVCFLFLVFSLWNTKLSKGKQGIHLRPR